MSLTLAGIQQEVLDHGFSDSRYRTYVTEWANEGQNRIALQADIRNQVESVQFSTSTFAVNLPTDFARLVEVANASDSNDWQLLYPMELRDFDEVAVSYGTPTNYVISGGVLYLYPYPDASVSIVLTYYRLPAALSASTDVPEIPAVYHHLLVRYCLIRAYEREADYEAAAYNRQSFEDEMMKLRGEAQHDTADGPSILPGTWSDEGSVFPSYTLP